MEDWESVPLAPMRNNHPQVIQLLDSAKPTVPSFKNALHSIPEDKDKKSQDSVFSLWRANPYSPITEDVYATAKNTYTVEESNLKETLNTDLSGKGYSYDTLSAPTLGSLGKDTNTLMGIMAMLTMTAKPRSTREKSTLPPAELSKMNFGKDNTESRTYDDIDEDIANALARQRAASSVTMASTNENDDDSDLLSSSFGSIGDKVSKESRVTEENNEQANTKEDMNDLRTVKSSRGTKKMEADEESFTDSPVVELSERNTEYMNEWQMNRKLRTMSHISPKSYSVTDFRVTSQTTEETEAYSADHSTFSNSVTTNNDEDISEDDEVDSTSPIHTTARRATSRTLAHTDLIDTSPSEKVNRRSKTVSDIGASSTVYQISKELDSTDATSNDVSEKETILPSVAALAKTTQSDSSNSVSLEKGKDITNAVVKDEINAYSESILYFNNEGELSISTPLISGSESLPRLTVFYSPTDNSVSKVDGAETDEVRRKPTTREALLQENRTHRRNEKSNKKHTKTFLKASVSQPQMYSITRDSLLLASRTNNLENESGTSGSMDSFTTENTWEKKKVSEPLDTKDISQSISLSDREGNIAETEDPKTYITVSNKGVKVRLGTDSVSGCDVTSMTNGKGLTSKGISDERTSSVSVGVKRKSSGDKERNNELINWDEFDLSDYISTDDKTSNIAPTPDGHQFHRELKKGPVNNKFRDSCTSTLDDEIKLEVVTNDGISDTFPTRHRAVKNTPDMSSTIPLCASASRLPSDELAAFVSSDATVKEIACDIKTLPASQETDQSIENASSEEYDAAVNAEKVARALEEAIGLATTSAVRWERCARKRRSVRDEDAVRLEVTVGAIDPWVRPSSQFPVPPLRLVPETLARRPLPPLSPLSPLPPAPLLPSVPHTNAWRLQGAQERPSQFHGLRGEAAAQNDNAMLKQIPNPLPASILGSAKMHPDTLPLWKKAFEKTGGSSRLRLNPNPSGESWEQPKASKVPSVERTDPATVSLPAVGDVPLDGVLISKPPNWRQAATHHSSFNSIRDSARGFVYQPAGLPSGGLLKRPLHSNYEWQNPVSYVASTEGRTRNEWGMKVSDVQANSAPTLTQYLPITVMYQRDGDNELTLDPVEAQAMANDLTSAKAEQKMPDEEQTPYNVLMPLMSGPETLNDEHEMNMQEDGKKEEKIIAVGGKRSTCRRVSSHTEHMRLTGENILGVEVGASRNAERPMSHGSLLISEADESTNADGESDDDEPQDTTVYNMPVSNERKVVEEYSMPELEVGNPKNSEYPESKFTVVETDRESTLKDIPVVEVHFPEKANLDSTAPVVRFEKKENHESKEKLGFERTTPQQQASERIQPIQSDLAKVEDDLMYTERSISQSTELLNKVNNVLPDIEINGAKISLRPIPPSKGCSNNDIALAAISQKDLRPPASSSHMEECNSPEICKGFCEGSFTNVKSTDDISGTSVLTSKKWDSKEHSSPTVALVMISYPTQTTPSAKHKTENKNTKACLPEDDENSATTEELCEPAVTESTIRTTKQTQRAKYTEPYKRTRTKRQTETSESCHSSVVCMIGSNKKHNESEGASTNFNQLSSNDTHSNIIISINVSLPVSESSSLKSSRTTKRFSRSSTVSAITTSTAAGNKMTQYAMEGHEPSFPIASKPPRTLVMGAKPQNKTAKVDNHLVISFGNEESAAAEFAVKQKKSTEENYKCVTIDPGPEILQNFQDAHGAVDDLQEKDHFQSHKIADAAASDSLDLLTTGQRMRVGPSANVNNLKFMSKDSVPRLSINIHRIDNIDGVESNAEKSDEVLRSQFDGEKMQTHEGDVMVDYEPLTRSEAPGNAVDSANEHGWIAKPQATPTGVIDDTQRKLVHLQLHRDSGGIEGMLEKGESRVEVNRRKPGHKSELVRLEHPSNDHRHRPHATYSVSADKEDTSSESSRHPAVLGGHTDHRIQLEGYRHSPESSNIARREHRDPESSAVLMLIPGDRSDSKIGPCSAEELTAHDKQDDTVGEVSGGPHYGTIAIRKPTVMRGSRRGFQSSTSDITGSDTTASGTTDSAKTVSGSTVSGSTVSGTSVSGTTGSDTTGSNLTSSDTTVSDITTSGTTAADTTASGTTATGTTASGTTATGTTASGTTASASTVSDTITPDTTTSESTVSGTTASDTTESGTAVSSTIAKLGRTSDFGKQSTFPTSSMRPLITDINVNAEISASAATTPASTSNSKTQISETSRATETSGLCSTQTSGGNSTKTSTTHSKKPSSSTRKYNTMATCTRKTLKMCTTPRTTRKRTTIKRTKPPKTCASPTIPIKKTKVTKLKCTKQTVTRNTTRSTKTTRYTTRKAITTRPPKTTRRCIAKLTKSTRCTKLKVTKCVTVRLAKPKPIRTTALRKCTTKSCITQKKAKKTTRKCVYVNTKPTCLTTRCKPKTTPCPVITTKKITTISPKQITTNCTRITPFITTLIFKRPEENELATGTEDQAEMALPELSASSSYHFNLDQMTSIEPSPTTLLVELVPDSETISSKHRTKKIVNTTPSGIVFALFPDTNTTPSALPTRYKENTEMSPIEPPLDISSEARSTQSLLHSTHIERNELLMGSSDMSLMFDLETSRMQIASTQFVQNALSTTMASLHMMPLPSRSDTLMASVQYSPNTSAYGVIPEQLQTNTQSMGLPATGFPASGQFAQLAVNNQTMSPIQLISNSEANTSSNEFAFQQISNIQSSSNNRSYEAAGVRNSLPNIPLQATSPNAGSVTYAGVESSPKAVKVQGINQLATGTSYSSSQMTAREPINVQPMATTPKEKLSVSTHMSENPNIPMISVFQTSTPNIPAENTVGLVTKNKIIESHILQDVRTIAPLSESRSMTGSQFTDSQNTLMMPSPKVSVPSQTVQISDLQMMINVRMHTAVTSDVPMSGHDPISTQILVSNQRSESGEIEHAHNNIIVSPTQHSTQEIEEQHSTPDSSSMASIQSSTAKLPVISNSVLMEKILNISTSETPRLVANVVENVIPALMLTSAIGGAPAFWHQASNPEMATQKVSSVVTKRISTMTISKQLGKSSTVPQILTKRVIQKLSRNTPVTKAKQTKESRMILIPKVTKQIQSGTFVKLEQLAEGRQIVSKITQKQMFNPQTTKQLFWSSTAKQIGLALGTILQGGSTKSTGMVGAANTSMQTGDNSKVLPKMTNLVNRGPSMIPTKPVGSPTFANLAPSVGQTGAQIQLVTTNLQQTSISTNEDKLALAKTRSTGALPWWKGESTTPNCNNETTATLTPPATVLTQCIHTTCPTRSTTLATPCPVINQTIPTRQCRLKSTCSTTKCRPKTTCRPRTTPCPIPNLLGDKSTAVAAACEWSKLLDLLDRLDEASAAQMRRTAMAQWDYETNMTDQTRCAEVEAAVEQARFQKGLVRAAREIMQALEEKGGTCGCPGGEEEHAVQEMREREAMRRLAAMAFAGTAALCDEKVRLLEAVVSDMEETYGGATVCSYTRRDRCDMRIDPDVARVMTISPDPAELTYYWRAWHDATGRRMRHLYPVFVRLMNEAAHLNEMPDASALWLAPYEEPRLKHHLKEQWQRVRPLYLELHAHVRRRLRARFGPDAVGARSPLPAQLLGPPPAQAWGRVLPLAAPFPRRAAPDVSSAMRKQGWTAERLFREADAYMVSLNLSSAPASLWLRSMFEQPSDRRVMCHASAWDFFDGADMRVKACASPTIEDLAVACHEMGHVQYFLQYAHQPMAFREAANPGPRDGIGVHSVLKCNVAFRKLRSYVSLRHQITKTEIKVEGCCVLIPRTPVPLATEADASVGLDPLKGCRANGFHEAVGDVIALAVTGEPHMRRLKMMPCQRPSASEGTGDNGGYERGGKKCRGMRERQLNALMADALERLPLMPVALALERWRWDAFMGNVRPRSYTLHWWRLMEKYAGMGPPVPRSEEDFDPGAKYHVAAGAPYIQYFVSGILQFQLFRSLCIKAGQFDPRLPARKPLHQCDLYGNSVVAESLKNMMRLGSSVPWPEALAEVTCGQERALDAQGFLDYFSPLFEWLRVENARTGEPLGWDSEYKMKVFSTSKRKRNQRSDEANLGDMIGEVDDGG